jgi:hypothetical protein
LQTITEYHMNMKAASVAVSTAAALNLLQLRDPVGFEKLFQLLTPASLTTLHDQLAAELEATTTTAQAAKQQNVGLKDAIDCCNQIIAQAIIRRLVFKYLQKYSEISAPDKMEHALKYHSLPEKLQKELVERYGGDVPKTWYEALQQLKHIADKDPEKAKLWELVQSHPMTAYIPVQCQSCGHVVPDDLNSDLTDEQLGLTEEEPMEEERPFVRSGWFRGPRTQAKVFALTCPECGTVSRWFRSRDPQIILNPNRWGRLCGEQEDLRLDLANYLGIPIRTCVPLDWDHVWSEYGCYRGIDTAPQQWMVLDNSARNFAVRLDEGIGFWTGVLAIHPHPDLCEDVTQQYLSIQGLRGGRADIRFNQEMPRYRKILGMTKEDASGAMTQAGTVMGYALQRAGFDEANITAEMKLAAKEYRTRSWFDIRVDDT